MHAKIRAKQNQQALRRLKAFTDTMARSSRVLGAMNTPSVLTDVARNYTGVTDIVLFGSALFDNPSHPSIAFTGGAYPNDDFILAPATQSVFGTQGLSHLSGKRIHWALPAPFAEPLYANAVTRFYHIYINALGGDLVSFTSNIQGVLQRLVNDDPPLLFDYRIEQSGQLEMRTIHHHVVSQSVLSHTTSNNQENDNNALPVRSISPTHPLILGIQWEGEGIDVDIYAQPHGSHPLYFGYQASEFGIHVKDERTGGGTNTRFYERIELHKPFDKDTLRVGINLYDAPAQLRGDVSGIVSLSLDNITYETPFRFDLASGGNKGADIIDVLNSGKDTALSRFFTLQSIMDASSLEVAGL
jgi:hypothetical protein